MENILKIGRDGFLAVTSRQNIEWNLIDSGVLQEDVFKPLPPKKYKILKFNIK